VDNFVQKHVEKPPNDAFMRFRIKLIRKRASENQMKSMTCGKKSCLERHRGEVSWRWTQLWDSQFPSVIGRQGTQGGRHG
jgi:hypothetical protein